MVAAPSSRRTATLLPELLSEPAVVAQWLRRLATKPECLGSNPAIVATFQWRINAKGARVLNDVSAH